MPDDKDLSYIGSADYQTLEPKMKKLKESLEDLTMKCLASRKLRYAEVDIEAEREEGRLQPDELFIPQHIIDTNIRREQSAYVQYVVQSPRAVIAQDQDSIGNDLALLEQDLTKKIRFKDWQLSLFSNIDSFQANGYAVMEQVLDIDAPGGVAHESIQYGDFAFVMDTRDLQQVEMTARAYYFTKTRLVNLCGANKSEDANMIDKDDSLFKWNQVEKVISTDPNSTNSAIDDYQDRDRSLYKIYKVMFKVKGVVQVAWCSIDVGDDWLRVPRPLFIGNKTVQQAPQQTQLPGQPNPLMSALQQGQTPPSQDAFETDYPYFIFPYLISENDTIANLKGRVFLDQDLQEGVSSLVSSTVTKARRSAGMYFSKDVSDPNDDLLLQKNVFFKSGCLINSKIQAFTLEAPDPGMFSAINMLVTANQNETSQVNFAVQNRKDSRKTAKEIEVADQQSQVLSTVQVVLFSLALTKLYTSMCRVIKSRVQAGLIKVDPKVLPLYFTNFIVKPSGDTDVIEKQQLIQKMMQAWPVVQQTPFAQAFLMDLIKLSFPQNFDKYLQMTQQAMQQQQSQQAQMMQQLSQKAMMMANQIIELSKHQDMFSDKGKLHAYPVIASEAQNLEQLMKQLQPQKQG